MQAERANLKSHKPEVLQDLGIQVGYHGIFCSMDGKMINAKLDNAWQARCPFCGCTPMDLRDGIDHMTDIETLKDLHSSPLHVLLRIGDGFFKAGFRNMAGVFKYDVEMTEDEKDMVEAWYEKNTFLGGNR